MEKSIIKTRRGNLSWIKGDLVPDNIEMAAITPGAIARKERSAPIQKVSHQDKIQILSAVTTAIINRYGGQDPDRNAEMAINNTRKILQIIEEIDF